MDENGRLKIKERIFKIIPEESLELCTSDVEDDEAEEAASPVGSASSPVCGSPSSRSHTDDDVKRTPHNDGQKHKEIYKKCKVALKDKKTFTAHWPLLKKIE